MDYFYINTGAVTCKDRVAVQTSLRQKMHHNLHAAHQGVSSIQLRMQSIVFWPRLTADILTIQWRCTQCSPVHPTRPPCHLAQQHHPQKQVFGNFWGYEDHKYLVVWDRLSGWSEVFATPAGSTLSGARGLISCLCSLFAMYGVPEELSSDGGPEFSASTTNEFFKNWGAKCWILSAYNSESNSCTEVVVKSAKRLLRTNTSPKRSLNHDNSFRHSNYGILPILIATSHQPRSFLDDLSMTPSHSWIG